MDKRTLRQLQMLGGDLGALWLEAAWVVMLRAQRLSEGGPAAVDEARLMVSEKVAAQQELAAALLAGRLGRNPLAIGVRTTRYFLKGVRGNRRRLSRR